MPGESISTRRRTIGTLAVLVIATSMLAGAVDPDQKKTVTANPARISGCVTPAGRELAAVLQASGKRAARTTIGNRKVT